MKLPFTGGQTTFLALIQGALGYEWLKSGIEKATDPAYIPGMTKTVGVFASKNPNGGFKSFLTGTIQPNAEGVGYAVMYGELLAGAGLAIGALVMLFRTVGRVRQAGFAISALAAFGGLVMNAGFWQAAGWLSPSTDGINVVMGLVEVSLGAAAITALVALRHQDVAQEAVEVSGTASRLTPAVLHR